MNSNNKLFEEKGKKYYYLSRISRLFKENKLEEIKERIRFSIDYIMFMGVGLCFGFLSISHRFVTLFFEEGYNPVVNLLYLLSPIIVIIGISNCLVSQYYNPAGLCAQSTKYIIIGSVFNLVLNLILILLLKSNGAVIASIVAEGAISFLYVMNSNKFCKWNLLAHSFCKKFIAAFVMFTILLYIERLIESNMVGVIVGCVLGMGVYLGVLYIFKEFFVTGMYKKVIGKLGRR